ncbi:MAG: type I phosphomannose isomerase catalytic subunit [Bdellovibrionota bacterium]
MTKAFYKCDPFNFVPLTRTPWAGTQISQLKRKFFPQYENKIPEQIGESWEVSTDAQFSSKIEISSNASIYLKELLATNPQAILGESAFHKYGVHFPLLLKWLEASDLLSVQLHPANNNPMLKNNECGKPEAWLVFNVINNGFVYLGFKESLSQEEIIRCLKNDELDKCLHKYFPKKQDYISVPPGCVHAIGPGVFVAEPQYVLPQKIGKTWRISDWRRLYNEQGQKSASGKPRELHVEESLSSINWNLLRGRDLEKLLIRQVENGKAFYGNENNPFAVQIFNGVGDYEYSHLIPNTFSLFTVWSGAVTLSTSQETLHLKGGESGFICADTQFTQVKIDSEGAISFFGLNDFYT